MDQPEISAANTTQNVKLYSSKAIGGATFLGGPLAAAYMIGENFKALQKPKEGQAALLIGISITIALFATLFMVPESIVDSIPRQIIPLMITAAAYGIVEWKMGPILNKHKEQGNPFFSGWRAAGIGFISLLVIMAGVFAYVFFGTNDAAYEQYDQEIAAFTINENETLGVYDRLGVVANEAAYKELEETTIPKWKENIAIIHSTNEIEDLPLEIIAQNRVLLEYAQLRLEAFELFKKALAEDTPLFTPELERIHQEIQDRLDQLNAL